jgi:superfamily I DNA and/or RNA helicase
MSPIEELQELKKLLLLEKKEDFEQFKALVESLPLSERKDRGMMWHPVETVKTGYYVGDRVYVTIKRRTHLNEPHQFRSGGIVNLVSHNPAVKRGEKSGVINFVDRNKMKIILNSNDLPDWLDKGEVGVDLMFDERTYLEMEKALNQVMKAKGDRLAELRDILLGEIEPTFNPVVNKIMLPSLNESQNEAVNQVLAAREVAIVHGPPGTGKTTTLVQALKLITKNEGTVLVCAPSNAAVDLLTERIAEQGINVVRIGNISRVNERLISHTLDGQMADHPEMKNIKKIKKQSAEARRKAKRFKRNFGSKERRERQHLFSEARELNDWANQMEDRLVDRILLSAQVITCTMVSAVGQYVDKMKFRTLFIDEAAQALEPASWIPIAKASRVIMFGDPLQLPPTVKSNEARKGGFHITLMEKALERHPAATFLLNRQYRMHESIMGFSNQQFYNHQLLADDSVRLHSLELTDEMNLPVEFIDTAGCGFDEKMNPEVKSRYNPEEFMILREHLYQLIVALDKKEFPSIGIISPYKEQVNYMKDTIAEDDEIVNLGLDINTIDAFQGQERDVIYISLVRSNAKGEIGFLKDYRRMNVAMTRARKKLVIVGDSSTLGNDEFYQNFMTYCEQVNGYRTAWEFMA